MVIKSMTLSKKHFIKIAQMIANSKDKSDLTLNLCEYFKEDNPLFNRETFLNYISKIETERGLNIKLQ